MFRKRQQQTAANEQEEQPGIKIEKRYITSKYMARDASEAEGLRNELQQGLGVDINCKTMWGH